MNSYSIFPDSIHFGEIWWPSLKMAAKRVGGGGGGGILQTVPEVHQLILDT